MSAEVIDFIEGMGADMANPHIASPISIDRARKTVTYTVVYRIYGSVEPGDDIEIDMNGARIIALPDEFPGGFEIHICGLTLNWVISEDIYGARAIDENSSARNIVAASRELLSRAFKWFFHKKQPPR